MAYLDIDTDVLRSCVATARQTNDAISEACKYLNSVVIHNDWVCDERTQLNNNTEENRTQAATIQQHSASFYQAVEQSSARFDEKEQENISRVNQVEELLGQIVSVVPGISGGVTAPAISSFDNISKSLGG